MTGAIIRFSSRSGVQDIRTLGANYTTLRVSTQVGSLADMLDNPQHKDELFRLGLRPGTVFACGIDFLLRLRPEALAPFQAELQARACMLTITMPTRRLDLVLFFGNKWSQMVSNPR